jgi:hypothetical protein
VKIAGQQGRAAVGGSISSAGVTHRHKMTTSRAMCRALRATVARSRRLSSCGCER